MSTPRLILRVAGASALSAVVIGLALAGWSPRPAAASGEGRSAGGAPRERPARNVVLEATDFDNAIGAVLDQLERQGIAGETLVVVTADHETGGLALKPYPQLPLGFEARWTTDYHTGAPVPVFSSGPGAARFGGVTDHAAIGKSLIDTVRSGNYPEAAR